MEKDYINCMWVARDKDGSLYIYDEKPFCSENMFSSNGYIHEIDRNFYPSVTFENSPRALLVKKEYIID